MPRHELTNVSTTGIGEKIASLPKVKHGKSNIWDPSVIPQFEVEPTQTVCDAISCSTEYMRMIKTNELRKMLHHIRLKHRGEGSESKLPPAVTALERWIMRYQIHNEELESEDRGDVVIPMKIGKFSLPLPTTSKTSNKKMKTKVDNSVDPEFVNDLMMATDIEPVAIAVATEMTEKAHQIGLELSIMMKSALKNCHSENNSSTRRKKQKKTKDQNEMKINLMQKKICQDEVIIEYHKHTIDVKLNKKLLKINPTHYDKLKIMFQRTKQRKHFKSDNLSASKTTIDPTSRGSGSSGGQSASIDSEEESEIDLEIFHQHLFCVLARYHTIQGHGFQAAVPEFAFDVLNKEFGVTFECFASPLNCRYEQFCSAFYDTDECFGSLGSFFKFFPTSGSFEANPPFEPFLMLKMAIHIEKILTKSNKPLSFVIIVPGWKECESWSILNHSKFKTRKVEMIAKGDHGFCDGASHQRKDRYRDSSFDTAIFILQNNSGKKCYSITDDKMLKFKISMAEGKPTNAMKLRQEKDGKGTADVCKGVYKGKKRNATGEGVMSRRAAEKVEKANAFALMYKKGKKRKKETF